MISVKSFAGEVKSFIVKYSSHFARGKIVAMCSKEHYHFATSPKADYDQPFQ